MTYDIARQGVLAGRIEQGAQRVGLRWFDSVVMARSMLSRYVAAGASRFGVLLLAAAVGLVFLWLLIRLLVRRLSIRQRVARIRRGEASVADATLLYRRMLHILQRRGYQKPPWFTPSEFAESLPVSDLATAAREFTATYNALRFGGHTQAATRLSISSRISRTLSVASSFGSCNGQSSRSAPGTTGHCSELVTSRPRRTSRQSAREARRSRRSSDAAAIASVAGQKASEWRTSRARHDARTKRDSTQTCRGSAPSLMNAARMGTGQ